MNLAFKCGTDLETDPHCFVLSVAARASNVYPLNQVNRKRPHVHERKQFGGARSRQET